MQAGNKALMFLAGLIYLYPAGILSRMRKIRVQVEKPEAHPGSLFLSDVSLFTSRFFSVTAPWERENFSAENLF